MDKVIRCLKYSNLKNFFTDTAILSDIFCFFTKNIITTLTGQRSVLLIYNIFLYLSSFMKWYQNCFYLFWLLIIRRDNSNPISISTTITLILLLCTRFVRVDIWNGRKTTEHIHLDIVIKYSFNVNITYINNTIYYLREKKEILYQTQNLRKDG